MADTIIRSQVLVSTNCPSCGVLHAFPETLNDKAMQDHSRGIHCPNGHRWVYTGKTEAQKERDKATAERERNERLQARLDRTEAERDRIERQRRATAGHLTRAKRRVAKGVCPCCTVRFEDLAGHMADKHPEYVIENA